jgi:hypothetical protein
MPRSPRIILDCPFDPQFDLFGRGSDCGAVSPDAVERKAGLIKLLMDFIEALGYFEAETC